MFYSSRLGLVVRSPGLLIRPWGPISKCAVVGRPTHLKDVICVRGIAYLVICFLSIDQSLSRSSTSLTGKTS